MGVEHVNGLDFNSYPYDALREAASVLGVTPLLSDVDIARQTNNITDMFLRCINVCLRQLLHENPEERLSASKNMLLFSFCSILNDHFGIIMNSVFIPDFSKIDLRVLVV